MKVDHFDPPGDDPDFAGNPDATKGWAQWMLRRGIPYGPALAVPFNGGQTSEDGGDGGLHILSFQTSIVNQFEVLQAGWANTVENPHPRGHDMIIGQTGGTEPLQIELMNVAGGKRTATTPKSFVATTGSGYFLSPSICTLADLARRT